MALKQNSLQYLMAHCQADTLGQKTYRLRCTYHEVYERMVRAHHTQTVQLGKVVSLPANTDVYIYAQHSTLEEVDP